MHIFCFIRKYICVIIMYVKMRFTTRLFQTSQEVDHQVFTDSFRTHKMVQHILISLSDFK